LSCLLFGGSGGILTIRKRHNSRHKYIHMMSHCSYPCGNPKSQEGLRGYVCMTGNMFHSTRPLARPAAREYA
jgi:hypothetical protein